MIRNDDGMSVRDTQEQNVAWRNALTVLCNRRASLGPQELSQPPTLAAHSVFVPAPLRALGFCVGVSTRERIVNNDSLLLTCKFYDYKLHCMS